MIQAEGVAYGGYHRLKVGALTDEIARLITRVAGFDLQSDEFQAIRYLVREWRDEYYRAYRGEQETPDSTEQGSEEKQTQNEFLMQYDLAYRIRRLDFVLNRIDRLYGLDQQAARTLEDLNIKPIPREEAEKQRFRTELWRSIFKPRKVSWVLREEEVMPGGHIGLTPSRRYGSLTVVRVHQYKISLSKVARCANGGRYPAAGVCGGAYLRA